MRGRWRSVLLRILLMAFAGSGRAQIPEPSAATPQLPRQAFPPAISSPQMVGAFASQDPFRGSVPSGHATSEEMPLSLGEAMERGLKANLGLLLTAQNGRAAEGARWRALSGLLPSASFRAAEWVQQNNLDAFGFPGFPGVSRIVGPFSVFDARASLSQPLLDFSAIHRVRAASANVDAANFSYQDARDQVVWLVANLYFRARAASSRVEAAQSQLKTAEALFRQTTDFKNAGVVPTIEVLRAQVEFQAQQQRLIFFQNEAEKQKLDLVRAIGLSPGQKVRLTENFPETAPPQWGLEEALDRAYQSREDYQRLLAQTQAAESERKAARAERYPSLFFSGDYGDLGRNVANSHGTFTATASLRIPLFQGGRIRGNIMEADARLQQRKAEREDLRSRIEYEVRVALLDLQATEEQVKVARGARELAQRQVEQAQDRFAAGVTSNIEVVQAQEAWATADENYISSLYSHTVAKASLAHALGVAEGSLQQFLRGDIR